MKEKENSSLRYAILPTALIFLFFFLVIQISPLGVSSLKKLSSGTNIPDMRFSYTAKDLDKIFVAFGPEGIKFYVNNVNSIDFAFILSYSIFFFVLLKRNTSILRKFPAKQYLPFLAFLPGILDLVESICLRSLALSFPQLDHTLVSFSSIMTSLKFIFFVLVIVFEILIILMIVGEKRKYKKA